MRIFFVILWFSLSVLAGTALFHTSEEVQKAREETAQLEGKIAEEKESLRVLKAEWAYLNQPDRLEKLAAEHLDLVPTKGRQLARLDAIPERAQTDNPLTRDNPVPGQTTGPVQKLITGYAPPRPLAATPLANALPAPEKRASPEAPRILPQKAQPPRDFGALLQSLGEN